MNTRYVLTSSVAALLALTVSGQSADTLGTFDPGATPGVGQINPGGINSGPTIEAGGPTDSFLRLLHDQGGQNNQYAFDATHDGNWSTLVGRFDFRLGDSGGDSADGLGFLLVPQSRVGATGPGLTDFTAEEPNTAGTLAIGLDMYPHAGTNDISLHWNGSEQTNIFNDKTNIVDLVNSGWHQAQVTYTQVGNGLNATVQLTRDVFGTPTTFTRIDQAVDARPYANRAQFTARTGGQFMSADVDNVNVLYTGTAATLPTINPGIRNHQDFDSLGASAYTARLHSTDGTASRPGPKLVASGGSGGGAFMRLVSDGQNSINSSIAMTRTLDGGLAPTRHLEVDFRMANPDNAVPADGLGILLLPTGNTNAGVVGAGPSFNFENPNLPNGLAIGLQVYAGSRINRVNLNWNGVTTSFNPDIATLDLLAGEWNRLHLETEVVSGGSNVSLSIIRDVNGVAVNVPIVSDHFISGFLPYDYRIQVGARTGGLNIQADVDNIRTFAKPTSYVEVNGTTFQNFDTPGSFYQAGDRNGFAGGSNANGHASLVAGGPSGTHLRLVQAANGQHSHVGFNQTIPSGSPKPYVESEFDFRMTGQVAGTERADGFSFGLYGVNTWGTTGPLFAGDPPSALENPKIADALTLGFRIYDADATSSTDYITLNYNGAEIYAINTNQLPGLWDLNNDIFHHAKLTLLNAGADTIANLTLTQDEFGAAPIEFTVFDDVTITGLALDTFDFRAGFGARTGGLNAAMDIDNVQVSIPEPGSAALLLGGLAMLTARRRRK